MAALMLRLYTLIIAQSPNVDERNFAIVFWDKQLMPDQVLEINEGRNEKHKKPFSAYCK